jgi:alginate O-acetyltransferase complex protein AlgI
MPFNSIPFLVFAPVFFILYFSLRSRARLVWCTMASYGFYAWWDWRFAGLILASTLVTFVSGKMIGRGKSTGTKKIWLWLCIGYHLSALVFFKYFNFCADSLKAVLHWIGLSLPFENPTILLPLGISFFTFTAISYVIDVNRGKISPAEQDLLVFCTYRCLFPYLVAGPIVRAAELLPQLKRDHSFDLPRVGSGVELIIWGYVLKLCLADNAVLFVNPRFDAPELFTSFSLATAVLAFALQIYGDFAGYSLIAIGLARIMGYELGINFDKPYFAGSISEFWRRWHISLGNWFRDYVFLPLEIASRNWRNANVRSSVNLWSTMLLVGLWHGASWNFVLWGVVQGTYMIAERLIAKPFRFLSKVTHFPKRISKVIVVFIVFICSCVGWVIFRSRDIRSAFYMLKAILQWQATAHLSFGGMKYQLARLLVVVLIVLLVELAGTRPRLRSLYERFVYTRVVFAGLAVLAIVFVGSFSSNSFIYFQF